MFVLRLQIADTRTPDLKWPPHVITARGGDVIFGGANAARYGV